MFIISHLIIVQRKLPFKYLKWACVESLIWIAMGIILGYGLKPLS